MKKEVSALLKSAPARIKVGGYPWTLRFEKDWIIFGETDDKKWGLCSPAKMELVVANTEEMPSKEFLIGIAFHEILHAIWSSHNLRSRDTEENVVSAFEAGLMQVFKDNPELLTWIKKGVK